MAAKNPASRLDGAADWLDGLQIELVPIGRLKPNPRNPRTHSRRQIEQIRRSIKVFGFLSPVLADDHDIMLVGHGRVAAARLEGYEQVPVIRLRHLTESQKRAYLIADNKIAEQAGWDRELLTIELGELIDLLPTEGLEVTLTGFEAAEIDLLLSDMAPARSAPDDTVPSLPSVPATRRGDLWQLKDHRLLCGDARDAANFGRLMDGDTAAAVFTDPPYNVRVHGIGGRGRTKHAEFAMASGEMSATQFRSFLTQTLQNGIQVSKDGAVHFVCMDCACRRGVRAAR